MAQNTFVDGDVLTASEINTYLMGEGGAWTSWTPTVTQSGSVTVTNTRSRYARYGRTIHFTMVLAVTGTGSGTNSIVLSLPVTAATQDTADISGFLVDASSSDVFPFIHYPNSTTTFRLKSTSSSSGTSLLGSAIFTDGLASGDTIRCSGTYEAAS